MDRLLRDLRGRHILSSEIRKDQYETDGLIIKHGADVIIIDTDDDNEAPCRIVRADIQHLHGLVTNVELESETYTIDTEYGRSVVEFAADDCAWAQTQVRAETPRPVWLAKPGTDKWWQYGGCACRHKQVEKPMLIGYSRSLLFAPHFWYNSVRREDERGRYIVPRYDLKCLEMAQRPPTERDWLSLETYYPDSPDRENLLDIANEILGFPPVWNFAWRDWELGEVDEALIEVKTPNGVKFILWENCD